MSFPRRFARGTLFWIFGLSASILIGSLWGSAAVGNRDTVAEVVSGAAAEQIAQERLVEWVLDGLASVGAVSPGDPGIADEILAMPETEHVLARLTDQVIDAAFAPVGTTSWIDPAAALLPAVPQLTQALTEEGVTPNQNAVAALVSQIEPVPLDGTVELPLSGAATRVSAALSLAAVLAGTCMVVAGVGAVLFSVDRLGAVRNLAYRFTLTSLSFVVLLGIGSWLADPAGGASPWRSGLSVLLSNHVHVPLLWGALAALVGAGAVWATKRRSNLAMKLANSGI
jgi:hypothetical protein